MMKLVFEGNPTYKVDKDKGTTECTMRGHVKFTYQNKTSNFPSYEVTAKATLREGDTWNEQYGRWLASSIAVQKMYHKARIDMGKIWEDLFNRFSAVIEMDCQLCDFTIQMGEYEEREIANQIDIEARIYSENSK